VNETDDAGTAPADTATYANNSGGAVTMTIYGSAVSVAASASAVAALITTLSF
jgi:hypothetical protein